MKEIVERLIESRRLDEVNKRKSLDSLADRLETKLSQIENYSHHKVSIIPNYEEGRVEIEFENTDDRFYVEPQRSKISNENSNKVIKVDSIDGAHIRGTKVYDEEGNLLGDALVRTRAIHNKSDYSEELEKAEFRFNSKITDIKKLEKYIASDAINNNVTNFMEVL